MDKDKDKKDVFCNPDKYNDKPIRFVDKFDHYELYFTDDFEMTNKECTILTDILIDLKEANKNKELHIFINSYGGYCMTLAMILSEVMLFKYRVTICMGAAMSCGILLWCCGNERYVSPYSELMLHGASGFNFGKGLELKRYGDQIIKLTNELYDTVGAADIFTKEELTLSETSEVYFLGSDLINRNKACPITDYEKRCIPCKKELFFIDNRLYEEINGTFKEYAEVKNSKTNKISYVDLIKKNTQFQNKVKNK